MVYVTHTHTHTHTHKHTHTHTRTRTHTRTHAHTHTRTQTHRHTVRDLGPTRKSMLPMESMLPNVKQTAKGLGLPSISSVSLTIENRLRNRPEMTQPAKPMIRSWVRV